MKLSLAEAVDNLNTSYTEKSKNEFRVSKAYGAIKSY